MMCCAGKASLRETGKEPEDNKGASVGKSEVPGPGQAWCVEENCRSQLNWSRANMSAAAEVTEARAHEVF